MKILSRLPLLFFAALLLVGPGLINLMPSWRLDLTDDKLYTLSDGTRNLIKTMGAREAVRFRFFFSDKTTQNIPGLRLYARRVKEMLHEYELQSGGKIQLEMIDTEPFSENEDEAASLGLQAIPAGNNDNIYFGLVADTAGDKREIITFFNPQKESSLEYDISQLLYRLQKPKPLVVGVISDIPIFQHRNPSSPQVIKPKIILDQLRQLFDIKRVYDNNIEKIDDEVDLLMVVHPHQWPEQTLYAIDQFVLRGGRLLVFMDPLAEMDQSENGLFGNAFEDKSSSLEQLLTAWGVDFDPKRVVLDYGFAHSIPATRYGQALPHVAVIGVHDSGFNRDDPMTAGVDQVNLATSGALASLPDTSTLFTPLMHSSPDAQLMPIEEYNKYGNHGDLLVHYKADGKGPYTMAALITGSVKTAFPEGFKTEHPHEHLAASSHDISVVLFADTDILDDRMWVQVEDFYGQPVVTPFASNSDLVVNVLEKLGGSLDLIDIRSRGSYSRPFHRVNDIERKAAEHFREQEENLKAKLADTEKKIIALKHEEQNAASDVSSQELTLEQQAEIDRFQSDRLQIRKKLREVQHQLNKDIDSLGTWLKVINILAIPLLLSVITLILVMVRRRRLSGLYVLK